MKNYDTKENTVVTWICGFLCVILSVILILNVAVIVKRYQEREASLNLFGHFPVIILSDELKSAAGDGDLAIFVGVDPNDLAQGDLIVYRDKTNGMSVSINFVEKVEDGIIVLSAGEGEQSLHISTDQVIGICAVSIPVLGWIMNILTGLPARLIVAALMVLLVVETYFYMSKRDQSDPPKEDGTGLPVQRRKFLFKKSSAPTTNGETDSPSKKRRPPDSSEDNPDA